MFGRSRAQFSPMRYSSDGDFNLERGTQERAPEGKGVGNGRIIDIANSW